MKVIDAHWEQRNLGRHTAEILFAAGDSAGELPTRCFPLYDYIVAKVPVACLPLVHELEELGFRYLETQFEIVRDLRQPLSPAPAVQTLLRRIAVEEVTDAAAQAQVLAQVTPEMFATDRVSLDPLLGPDVGARRYRNWMQDELQSGKATLCELLWGTSRVGFFLLRHLDTTRCFATLAGLYTPYNGRGLGVGVVAKPIEWASARGRHWLVTRNSANNSESFKIHLSCGYTLSDILYLLRWAKPLPPHATAPKGS